MYHFNLCRQLTFHSLTIIPKLLHMDVKAAVLMWSKGVLYSLVMLGWTEKETYKEEQLKQVSVNSLLSVLVISC